MYNFFIMLNIIYTKLSEILIRCYMFRIYAA